MDLKKEYLVLSVNEEELKSVEAINQSKKKVCDVCGHVNDKNSFLCVMCSNYLNKKGDRNENKR